MYRRYNSNRSRSFQPKPQAGSHISQDKYVKPGLTAETKDTYTPKHSFSDFPLADQLQRNIVNRHYQTPTPIQDQAIIPALEGKDVVGIANTGTGKTAAFLLPIIHKIILDKNQKVLIMTPTRELAIQIEDELKAFTFGIPIKAVRCIGGENISRQVFSLRFGPNIVIGTPGRLKDLLGRGVLQLFTYQTVVLDEVDRMVDIGFIKDIRYLLSLLPPVHQSLFFSATLSPEVSSIIQTFLKSPITISVKRQETAQNVEQNVVKVSGKDGKLAKLQELLHQEEYKKVLIFGKTKWNVEKLANALLKNGIQATSIHGNKSQSQRIRALSLFKQNQVRVLVATDIAARGLDIDDVTHVINYDEPASYTDYIHRIGRTGRADKPGKALTFVV